MRLVDTSAWIEWLIASPTGETIASAIPAREDKADQVVAFTQMCHVAPLDTKIALATADLCRLHKFATADAIVDAAVLTIARLIGRQIAREEFERLSAANDNRPRRTPTRNRRPMP